MAPEEIAKEVIVAMIQKGLFDYADNTESQATIQEERTHAICQTFTSIAKTAYDCSGGNFE